MDPKISLNGRACSLTIQGAMALIDMALKQGGKTLQELQWRCSSAQRTAAAIAMLMVETHTNSTLESLHTGAIFNGLQSFCGVPLVTDQNVPDDELHLFSVTVSPLGRISQLAIPIGYTQP